MNEIEFQALVAKVGTEMANRIKTETEAAKAALQAQFDAYKAGTLTETKFQEEQIKLNGAIESVKEIANRQGIKINEMLEGITGGSLPSRSIAKTLYDDYEAIKDIYYRRSGTAPFREYIVTANSKGQIVMQHFDRTKAAGPTATIADVGVVGNTSSIIQNFTAATLLRLAADNTPITGIYRNTPWIFELANLVNVGFDQKFAIWFEETTKQGSSATVAEGATKPIVQYAYDLRSTNYLKEAMLVSFTQEFDMDFARLEDDILNRARIDLINSINSTILPRIIAAATAFNTAATYAPLGDKVATPNDWDVISALAAQVENNTFAPTANAALIGTNKKYRMGTIKGANGQWLNRPGVLDLIQLVSNPALNGDSVIVGDFKQYNILLRGGLIVKVGYNGNDFANNMFSVVIEQFYFDYITNARKSAIVKGPDFATVKTAIA